MFLIIAALYLVIGIVLTFRIQCRDRKELQDKPNAHYSVDKMDVIAEVLLWPVVLYLTWKRD